MKRIVLLFVLVLVFGFISGCSKKGGDDPVSPGGPAETEPNDQTPQSLGTLGTSDISMTGGTSGTGDVDRYSITTTEAVNLHVSIAFAGGADNDLGIENSNGIMLSHQDTGANPERCTLAASPAGTYIIEVTSKTASAVQYTLTVGRR